MRSFCFAQSVAITLIVLSALPTTVFLSVLSVATVFTAAAPITKVRDAIFTMEKRLHVYS